MWHRYSQHGVTKNEQFFPMSRIRLRNISFWKIISAFIDKVYWQVYKGCLCFLYGFPWKWSTIHSFIQTWHNWQLYIGHWKTAIKSWVHRACFRPVCRRILNSKGFFLSYARNVRNFNNRRNFVIIWQKLWTLMKSWVRLFVWAIIFQ